MRKYLAAFVSAMAVIALTLMPILVPAEHIYWLRWRIGAIVCGLIAMIALSIQLYIQYQEEKKMRAEDERRNQERDKKIDKVLQRLGRGRGRTLDSAAGTSGGFGAVAAMFQKEPLEERVANLAHEYYAYLQAGITLDTYDSRLKPKLLELLPELRTAPIKTNITESDVNPKRDQLTAQVRETADKLTWSAVRMTNPKTKILGKYLVLDEDDESD